MFGNKRNICTHRQCTAFDVLTELINDPNPIPVSRALKIPNLSDIGYTRYEILKTDKNYFIEFTFDKKIKLSTEKYLNMQENVYEIPSCTQIGTDNYHFKPAKVLNPEDLSNSTVYGYSFKIAMQKNKLFQNTEYVKSIKIFFGSFSKYSANQKAYITFFSENEYKKSYIAYENILEKERTEGGYPKPRKNTYESRTLAELRTLAAKRNIKGRSTMNKRELIAALRLH